MIAGNFEVWKNSGTSQADFRTLLLVLVHMWTNFGDKKSYNPRLTLIMQYVRLEPASVELVVIRIVCVSCCLFVMLAILTVINVVVCHLSSFVDRNNIANLTDCTIISGDLQILQTTFVGSVCHSLLFTTLHETDFVRALSVICDIHVMCSSDARYRL